MFQAAPSVVDTETIKDPFEEEMEEEKKEEDDILSFADDASAAD